MKSPAAVAASAVASQDTAASGSKRYCGWHVCFNCSSTFPAPARFSSVSATGGPRDSGNGIRCSPVMLMLDVEGCDVVHMLTPTWFPNQINRIIQLLRLEKTTEIT